ncbi:hypothetical protein BHU72_00375 [Desulfuribacillus stibiiarsenatis]|uniref:CBS domain-containing protein n=1 Tax=Desulfuribacillus stibiiarsenatis TaxID=1390249 RepID=A0A1E5L9D6_9FIRM|nr:CBS domain-containing protein [Desulfuribacillus stibiiarsenatis]OEH86765.1 hypothetical protein BHU72_00375 [Desulfuribacillus stibiiarsenatis]
MQVILSHLNIDFDGLASIIAAKKLYPKAKMVLPEKLSISVKQYLAIYKDSFDFHAPKQIDWKSVTHVIMVDIANLDRVGNFSDDLRRSDVLFTVYDHHQPAENDVKADSGKIESIGATVTMLVEEIQEKNISMNAFEATLMALGLYMDTGSFRYIGTTARDLLAAGYLVNQGANLAVISQYEDKPLGVEQQKLLNILMQSGTEFPFQGVDVMLATHRQKSYLGGLSLIASKMMDVTGVQALILIIEMGNKVFIVGRSSSDRIDVLPVINALGGGGHSKAASATIKDGSHEDIVEIVKSNLAAIVKPAVTARDMMSSPVKTISPDTSIEDSARMMLRYGHTGFPVVDVDKLVGIISRRDLDKATHHGLGHAPVKGFMSKEVRTIEPNLSVEEIQNIMIEENVGRLPVVEDDKLIGIVSRTNVVEYLHGRRNNNFILDESALKPLERKLKDRMKKQMELPIYQLLLHIGEKADEIGVNAYIIGGVVRDLVIGYPNEDIDIVIEGDGIQFANLLAEQYGGTVRGHEKFGTATWKLPNECLLETMCRPGLKIDITTARREYYDYPAALPNVERSTLREDLFRRDFTINAMAIQINKKNFGMLIDYFHGSKDIKEKKIKVLYNLSFVEDPTRILRAVRFEKRFGYAMDKQTRDLAINSVDKISSVSEVRISNELRMLFNEQHPIESIQRLSELGAWEYIIGEGVITKDKIHQLQTFKDLCYAYHTKKIANSIFRSHNSRDSRAWIGYFVILFHELDNGHERLVKYALNNEDLEVVDQFVVLLNHQELLDAIRAEIPTMGMLHKFLKEYRYESIVIMIALLDHLSERLSERIIEYLMKREQIPQYINGETLKVMGLKPSPMYAKLFSDLELACIDGNIKSKEDALRWVEQYIKKQ